MPVKNAKQNSKNRPIGRPGPNERKVGPEHLIRTTKLILRDTAPAKLTRAEIARRAGVTPGLVRYYFDDLTKLLTAVLDDLIEDFRREISEITATQATPKEKLRMRVVGLVRFLAMNPNFHQLFVEQVILGKGPLAANRRAEFSRAAFGNFESLIEDVRDSRDIDEQPDFRFLYIAFVGAAEHFTSGWPIFGGLFPDQRRTQKLVDAYADFLADSVLRAAGATDGGFAK